VCVHGELTQGVPASHKDDHDADDDAAETNGKPSDDAQLLVMAAFVPRHTWAQTDVNEPWTNIVNRDRE